MNNPNRQVTFIQLINILNDIANKHSQIKSFFAGDLSNYHPVDGLYPLMYVQVPSVVQRLTELEYAVNILIVDRLETDQTNLMQVLNDTLQISTDIRSLLKYGNQISTLLRIDDASQQQGAGTQIVVVSDAINTDIVAGWNTTLKIRTDFVNNICTIPGINGTTYTYGGN